MSFDGNLFYTGRILLENYVNPDKISKLISLGNLVFLGTEIGEKIGSNFVLKSEEQCLFFNRDYNEDNAEAIKFLSLKEFYQFITKKMWTDYYYLWDVSNSKWMWGEVLHPSLEDPALNLLITENVKKGDN